MERLIPPHRYPPWLSPRNTRCGYVWSAVLSQAKSESDRLVRANVFDLCWSLRLLARMECAALSPYLIKQSWKRLLPTSGLESAGFDRCAISLFASRPGRKQTTCYSGVAVELRMWESRTRFPSLALPRRHLQVHQAAIVSAIRAGR